mgnify:CR=1 FL=1
MPKSNSQFNPLANKVQGKQIDSLMKRLKKVEAIQALPAVSGGEILTLTKTFTDSEVNNLGTTPVDIIPAPTAPDNFIQVFSYIVSYDAGSYSTNTIQLQYSNGTEIGSSWGDFNFSFGDSIQPHMTYGGLQMADNSGVDTSVQLTGTNGTGNGTLEITVFYVLATVNVPLGISDERLKDNIVILNTINGLEMATWTWNEKAAELGHTGQGFGVIAQQAQTVIPDAVIEGEDGYLRVDYSKVAKHLEMILV